MLAQERGPSCDAKSLPAQGGLWERGCRGNGWNRHRHDPACWGDQSRDPVSSGRTEVCLRPDSAFTAQSIAWRQETGTPGLVKAGWTKMK